MFASTESIDDKMDCTPKTDLKETVIIEKGEKKVNEGVYACTYRKMCPHQGGVNEYVTTLEPIDLGAFIGNCSTFPRCKKYSKPNGTGGSQ